MTAPPEAFAFDLFLPAYRPMRCGDWQLRIVGMSLVPGYWSAPVLAQDMAVLTRGGDTWMSMTPYELESQEIGVRLAHGHVLVFGLGMGWSAAASALNDAVSAVTVIEFDPDVLAMHRELNVFDQLPPAARAKIRIEQGDAYAYRPSMPVDLLMPDIWQPLVSDGRVDEVRRMQAHVNARAIYFWGQEMEIARHAARAGRALDRAGIAATIAGFGLPLIGLELSDYPKRVAHVARRWMNGRWLPALSA